MLVYRGRVDVLSDLLHRARAKNAVVRQLIQRPPWSITLADQQPLSVAATLEGSASISLQNADTRAAAAGAPATHMLEAGDIALIKGGAYTIADDPRTPSQVVIRDGIKRIIGAVDEGVAGAAHVIALRSWGANTESELPTWLGAVTDPTIGQALAMLHADPRQRWTTATLAKKVGMSRAAFSARFTGLVGEPPMAYLTGWRMTLAADLLRDTEATVTAVAHQVGYENAFAFSTAFKRTHGHSPTAWRRLPDRTATNVLPRNI